MLETVSSHLKQRWILGQKQQNIQRRDIKCFFSQEFCRGLELTLSFHISFTCLSLFDFVFQSAGKFFGRVDAPVMQQLIRSGESSTTGVYNK